MSKEKRKRTALVYDFDGTLARGCLQDVSFIPDIGMKKKKFWEEVRARARDQDVDEILMYMQLMLEKKPDKVTAKYLSSHGKGAKLFDGLADRSWFDRINKHANGLGLSLEHYIVSSGIEEMIEGCRIRDAFTSVFASKFHYRDCVAECPGVAINYTTKTQYLYRISKGIENHWDRKEINRQIPSNELPIPFRRMVFLGDGDTDVPSMTMLRKKGGHSVAVYDPKKNGRNEVHELIADNRVNFVAPADYREGSELGIIVKGVLSHIARHDCPVGEELD
ncbi:MAG: HAD family hydrolase [Rhodobacteraceae bacterium]|nr:HAD family hydrolase [Paracoccaceae bacterium]MCY4141593.1 HAD family hydrolase [Paracoccaceae bacterium]